MNNIAKPILRILSGLIDLTLFIIPSTYLVYRLSYSSNIENVLDRLWPIIILVLINNMIMVTINSFFISQFGGTVGKLLTGTRIVNPNGQNLSFWRAFFRNQMGYMVSGAFLWLGFLWIFFDKEVRAWHDMIVDSYVVIVSKQTYILGV
ncbi:MAG TPA: RDD family protein, partial [Patescibacteria group bacterium]|nr:RDD family protein [Patescibacteria group bacterium]